MNYQEAYTKLKKFGQEHVLKYYNELTGDQQASLLQQIDDTDFTILDALRKKKSLFDGNVKIEPLKALTIEEIDRNRERYTKTGLEAIRAGRIGAVLLAGGMGTRLGAEEPKCMYDIGITHPVYIMERLITNLLDVVKQAGVMIPLFIMTSEKNNDQTQQFMKDKNCFGYDPSKIFYFIQDMAPATDYNGKVYMEAKDRISTSPNGNGGWFRSMVRSGLADRAKEMGVEYLNIFAVDNVLQRIADPCFVGATLENGCACAAKAVRKASRDEKVGVMCLENGKPSVIEYYEMTDELLDAVDENGQRKYDFGVIMNYLFRGKDLRKALDKTLPIHVVEKKIPCLDENGNLVHPDAPNGYKFEQLVVDMVRNISPCLPYEVIREKEFAPIKNATGVDSVETARELCRLNGIEL